MSRGITPIEFVRQVYYAQEKVYLDFVPSDDKYKEVLLEANFVLQELQKEEDWNWLRSQKILGITQPDQRYFVPPEDFYKQSTMFNDAIRLYAHRPKCVDINCPNYGHADGDNPWYDEDQNEHHFEWDSCKFDCFDRAPFIVVPWVPVGWQNDFAQRQMSYVTRPNVQDFTVGASLVNDGDGEKIILSRPLFYPEIGKVAVLQYQRLIEQFHICDDTCVSFDGAYTDEFGEQTTEPCYDPNNWHPCSHLVAKNPDGTYDASGKLITVLTQVPDPFYVIIRTAQYHAEGSPPAQGRIAGLQDQAQKMLSAMRENNAAATHVDTIPSWNPGFWMVI